MFIYLLIASELAVLYTVFWYLYVRQPKCTHRIQGSLWGTYGDSAKTTNADPTISFARWNDEYSYLMAFEHARLSNKKAIEEEWMLDQKTSHYVPVDNSGSLLRRMAAQLDRSFSQLNVHP
jgi:hypothetical protein